MHTKMKETQAGMIKEGLVLQETENGNDYLRAQIDESRFKAVHEGERGVAEFFRSHLQIISLMKDSKVMVARKNAVGKTLKRMVEGFQDGGESLFAGLSNSVSQVVLQ